MYRIVFLLCLWLGFSHSKPRIESRIIGGEEAFGREFPWQAAVYVDTVDGKFFCGGSLVAAQWILTAAHCLYNGRVYTIHLGSNTLQSADGNRIILATSTAEMHPDFNIQTYENDIGLIKLHIPIEFSDYIQPVHLPSASEPLEGSVAIAAGWGQIDDSIPGIVNNLMFVSVAVISNEECRLTYGNQITPNMVCTLGNFNEGICLGDTGGPLVKEIGFNEFVQIGVAGFFSSLGCEALHPSGFARTTVYLDWIHNVTGIVIP